MDTIAPGPDTPGGSRGERSKRDRSLRTALIVPSLVVLAGCPPSRPPVAVPEVPAARPPTTAPAPDPPPGPFDEAFRFDLAPPALGEDDLSLWATYYDLPEVVSVEGGQPLRDLDGRELGPRLAPAAWCDAALEGSVTVLEEDGPTTYNYAGTGPNVELDCRFFAPAFPAIGRTRFRPARGPFGDGVRDWILVPYRTIAVDRRTVPYGSVVYIPDARGTEVVLPSGEARVHDGYFYAADTGGAIKGNHIDVYIGPRETNPFGFVGNRRSATFPAYVVSEPGAEAILERAHRGP